LQALLEVPGQVVSRDELRHRLWGDDVHVDFEAGLNTAANRLRLALGDSAENPRFVETLARTGYRFIAPVQRVDGPRAADVAPAAAAVRRRWLELAGAMFAAAAVGAALASTWFGWGAEAGGYRYQQLTFRHGQVGGARFAPDGQSVVYGASWDLGARQLYLTNGVSPESRSLGFDDMRLVAVSRTGQLALLGADGTLPIAGGVLYRVAMNGGSPQLVERRVMSADWGADDELAIARAGDGASYVEWPIGRRLFTSAGQISDLRVSPDGRRLAFVDHPVRNDSRGSVLVVEPGQDVRRLTSEWGDIGGLAWRDDGHVWFTATNGVEPKSLWSVAHDGRLRRETSVPGAMTLRDVAANGRILVSRDSTQIEMAAMVDGAPPVDLSWLDWSRVADVSADGRVVLFNESGVAADAESDVYVHRRDGGTTVRIGKGTAQVLSPDATHALIRGTRDRQALRAVPLDGGAATPLVPTGLDYQWAQYFPDGTQLLALASMVPGPLRLWVVPLAGGAPRPLTAGIVARNATISPDGASVAVFSADGELQIVSAADGAQTRRVPVADRLAPLRWSGPDTLLVQRLGGYTEVPLSWHGSSWHPAA
jgi:eukaryotic-like serine/threonine-protein kinase